MSEKKSIGFRREQTNQSLRPVDSQTEGKRALMKKGKTVCSLKSLSLLEGWTCGLNLTREEKRNEHGEITSLGKIRPFFLWELQKFDTVPPKTQSNGVSTLRDHTTPGWCWDTGLPEERLT